MHFHSHFPAVVRGIGFFDETRPVLDVVANFMDFFVHESCGFCTPCRVGGTLMQRRLQKIMSGRGSVAAPFIGSLIFELLRTYAFELAPQSWQLLVGGTLLLIIFFLPGGLWSLVSGSFRRQQGPEFAPVLAKLFSRRAAGQGEAKEPAE